ncbi:polynucleotide 5'-hydroxyl-kinase NOL9-like isoform X2 [Portunus trituberculatus]|uniref:polynucleotide 5'-hydroxyl-kinase NOL9-like isoform X2 n=1 Tax=Portunus trituberculatus TaxID=210409 RepID=UPI001E1CC18A|nr:polynucleotide 5'-hydroxyl-kinase NOL9-like isoform X2 [Portunus trituberculatus]
MFSARLIRKKVEKTSSSQVTRDKKTTKRKRKNGKVHAKPLATRKKRLRVASDGASTAVTTTTITTGHQNTATDTDINKNKVNRSTQKDKRAKRKTQNTRSQRESSALWDESERVPVLYRNTDSENQLSYDSESSIASFDEESHQDAQDLDTFSFLDRENQQDLDSSSFLDRENQQDLDSSSFLDRENQQDLDSSSFLDTENQQNLDSQNTQSCNMASKKHRHKKTQEGRVDTSLIGKCLKSVATERGSVVAAIAENTTLYLQGCLLLRPLLGSVEVLGYIIQQGKSQAIYSLPSCSLLGVTALDCVEVEAGSGVLQGLPSAFVDDLVEMKTKVTLLEVLPHSSQRLDLLMGAGWGSLGTLWDHMKPWESIGAAVVTPKICSKARITHIKPEWKEAAQMVVSSWSCGAVPRVVVCGGKGVGKSTFFKYLANTMIAAQPDTGILCLDFDPGQPELSLPTSLSLTHLTKPLLGPPYTHDLAELSLHHRHVLVGSVNPQFVLEEYVSAVQELCRAASGMEGDLPLLVNTMGWTRGTGLEVMLDVVRLVQPTHVLQFQDHRNSRNYPFPLTAAAVTTARGGIATSTGTEVHYSLTLLPSAGPGPVAPNMAHPRVQRELRVLAEAALAMEAEQRVTVPLGRVALYVCEEQVPRERLLQVLNAQLVALCRVDPSDLHTLQDGLPQCLAPLRGCGDLLGWGVVVGVDPLTRELHLATVLPPQQVTQQVNAIVMPRIHLPTSFYKLFCLGKGPYLEKERREGAGRLRVGRRIMPRGPRQ